MSTFDEDMKEMSRQVTQEVIFHINSTPSLYESMKDLPPVGIRDAVYAHSQENDNEFGTVFEAELDAVDWARVRKGI